MKKKKEEAHLKVQRLAKASVIITIGNYNKVASRVGLKRARNGEHPTSRSYKDEDIV